MDFTVNLVGFEKIASRFNKKYNIPSVRKLLEDIHFGQEQAGFAKIRNILTTLAVDEPDIQRQLVNTLNIFQCVSLAVPRIFHLCKTCILFICDLVQYIDVIEFSQIRDLDPDVKSLLVKVEQTILIACYTILKTNRSRLLGLEPWNIASYPLDLNKETYELMDKGTWNDFMEFLLTQDDVMRPPSENCILF